MFRMCPRHRVQLQEDGDELRCPAAPHEVRAWLVVDGSGAVWAAATRHRIILAFDIESPIAAVRGRELARPVQAFRPAA